MTCERALRWPETPVFVECGCCDHWHRPEFTGDCRDDAERFSTSDLEDRYGEALEGVELKEVSHGIHD
jgi:hypothetical protein